ncbi:MAG: prepilin peptidase [Anaerolineae bacterium]|nr:prepilin peptidase [Anaerolineae bacterium]MBT7189256.1 prepilin peptidase [Anaerolineae bacterium]MBT7990104.1 prepilin peptidase [Anaerolineae bacterium]
MKKEIREEQQVFSELGVLCTLPGYVHAIAHFCFRDNAIPFSEKMTADDVLPFYSWDKLVRTEISTLIGLMLKTEIDTILPSPSVIQAYLDRTEDLLEELHYSMMKPVMEKIDFTKAISEEYNPFFSGGALREPIFYSGESAYDFQYRDISTWKYKKDDQWLIANKGFSIQHVKVIWDAIKKYQNKKVLITLEKAVGQNPNEWTMLPTYTFTLEEIAIEADIDLSIVSAVIKSFAIPNGEQNKGFQTLSDFNVVNAYPIIPLENEYLLYQHYSLSQAFYETPFYWFSESENYFDIAMKNRGEFTEEFTAERLKLVFGKNRVFTNVNIIDTSKTIAGEIDVLVSFANRAIIVQAKSKKLTFAARKGNDNSIKDDFKKAIQNAYDQGLSCANLINTGNYKLVDSNGSDIQLPSSLKKYIFFVRFLSIIQP